MPNLLELVSVGRADRILSQEARTEMHLGLGAITNQVDRINVCAAGEDLRHLLHAVARGIEDMHFDVGADSIEELLVLSDTGGDKYNFLAGR